MAEPHAITCIRPGTPVIIGDKLLGTIAAISIRPPQRVQYEVVWWDNFTRHSEWLDEFEVAPKEKTTVKIGFKLHG